MTAGGTSSRDGVSVPPDEVEAHLACGWQLLNPSYEHEDVLLAPPRQEKDLPE